MLNKSAKHVTLSQNHMATTFDFTLAVLEGEAARAERSLRQSHSLVAHLEDALSEFKPESPIHRLNTSVPNEHVPMPLEALELLELSLALEEITEGAFSAAAKGSGQQSTSITFSREQEKAERLTTESKISFGAIGKGYALDQVRRLIESWGFNDYLLSAGGSSLCVSGFASPTVPWKIGWSSNGKTTERPLTLYSGVPIALGISGISEQGAHILDPRNSTHARGVNSALVSHPSAAYADALSTALFVLGWENGIRTFQNLIEKPSLALLDLEDTYHWNGTFQNLWGPLH